MNFGTLKFTHVNKTSTIKDVDIARLDPYHTDWAAVVDKYGCFYYYLFNKKNQIIKQKMYQLTANYKIPSISSKLSTHYLTMPWLSFDFIPSKPSEILFLPKNSYTLYKTKIPTDTLDDNYLDISNKPIIESNMSISCNVDIIATHKKAEILCYSFNDFIDKIVTIDITGTIYLWSLHKYQYITSYQDNTSITAALLCKDCIITSGKSGSKDQCIKIWNFNHQQIHLLHTIPFYDDYKINKIYNFRTINKNKEIVDCICVCTIKGKVYIYNLSTLQCLSILSPIKNSTITSISCSYDGAMLSITYLNGNLVLYQINSDHQDIKFISTGIYPFDNSLISSSFSYHNNRIGRFICWQQNGLFHIFDASNQSINNSPTVNNNNNKEYKK